MIVQPNVFKKAVAEQIVQIQNSSPIDSHDNTASKAQQNISNVDQLMKLAELKEKGLITEEEFNAQKAKYLQ